MSTLVLDETSNEVERFLHRNNNQLITAGELQVRDEQNVKFSRELWNEPTSRKTEQVVKKKNVSLPCKIKKKKTSLHL